MGNEVFKVIEVDDLKKTLEEGLTELLSQGWEFKEVLGQYKEVQPFTRYRILFRSLTGTVPGLDI